MPGLAECRLSLAGNIVAAILAGSLGASGCSSPTTAPLEVGRAPFALEEAKVGPTVAPSHVNPPGAISIDTRLGRRTRFAGTFRSRSIDPHGVPQPWVEQEFEERREIIGEDAIEGRIYARERYWFDPLAGAGDKTDSWYRQDRSGYYTSAGGTTPTGRKPAPPIGLAEGETTLLQYPVHRNQSWMSGFGGGLRYTLEAVEWLNTPAGRFRAARVRMTSEAGDPDQAFVRWYAEPGLVREFVRYVTRRNGSGTAIIAESEWTSEITEYTPGQGLPVP